MTGTQDHPLVTPVSTLVESLLANDTGTTGATFTVVEGSATGGTATQNDDGTVTFNPAPGATEGSYRYEICNAVGCSQTTVTVNLVAPVVAVVDHDTVTVGTDSRLTVTELLVNDSGYDASTFTLVGTPTNGTVTMDGDTVVFTPTSPDGAAGTYQYQICNTAGECQIGIVYVSVVPAVDAVPDTRLGTVNTPLALAVTGPTGLLSNDSGYVASTFVLVEGSNQGGSASIKDGQVVFIPEAGATTGSFEYKVFNAAGDFDTATVTITLEPAPVAVDDTHTLTVQPDGTALLDIVTQLTRNDENFVADSFQVTGVLDGDDVVDNLDGTVSLYPAAGSDTVRFTYQVCNAAGVCDEATATITLVAPVVAVDDAYSVVAGSSLAVAPKDLMDNDSGYQAGTFQLITGNAIGGSVEMVDGNVVFTPSGTENGSFTYTVCNAADDCVPVTATVTVTVTPAPVPPTATGDTLTTDEDKPVTVPVTDLTGNDKPGDQPLDLDSFKVTQQPNHGTVTIVDGKLTYTPNPGYDGEDTFTYEICDTATPAECATGTVTVTVKNVPVPPTATDDTLTTDEDKPVTVPVTDLTGNDKPGDQPLDPDTFTITTQPDHGTVSIENGRLTYTPDENWSGEDIFIYEICDTSGACASGTVTVTVTQVDDAPVARDDHRVTELNTAVTIDVLENDTDAENNIDPTTLVILDGGEPQHGTAEIKDGQIRYTPNDGFVGKDTFTYRIYDATGLYAEATVTVDVAGKALAPTAGDDTATVDEDGQVTIDLLQSDTDPNDDLLQSSVTVTEGPTNGTVEIVGGQAVYTPKENWSGQDTFTYQVCDATDLCDTATVTVTVNPVDDPPVAQDDTASTKQGRAVRIDVRANDTDIDSALTSPTIIENPVNGAVSVDEATGEVVYTPNAGFFGTDSFTYQVCDVEGLCDNATVTVTVTPVPLQAKDDKATAEPGEPVTLNPIANDDGDQLDPASVRLIAPDGSLVTELSVPGQGTWTVHADGTITFTPEEGFSGVAEARYQVTDVLGQRTTAAISVTVAGPDSPTDPTKPTDPTDPTDPAKPADPKPRPTPSTPAAPAPTTPAPTPQPTSPKSTSSGPSALAWTGTEAGVLGLFGGVLVGLGTMLQVLRRRRRA